MEKSEKNRQRKQTMNVVSYDGFILLYLSKDLLL